MKHTCARWSANSNAFDEDSKVSDEFMKKYKKQLPRGSSDDEQLFGTDQHKSPLSGNNSSLDVTTLFDLFANPSDSSSSQRITQPILQEVSQNVAGSSNSGDNVPSLLNHDLGSPHLSSDFPVSQPAEPIQEAPPTTLHPMVTRSRNGIFKPRVFLSNCSLPSSFLTETEPKNVKTAMADPKNATCKIIQICCFRVTTVASLDIGKPPMAVEDEEEESVAF
ncbi:hypothetical protein LWI29_017789 [Acer saccharum]|uniref:Uncharacterized protein n=1 Tax=Acer saccharum TaxID=4024 RepID=A0AA39SW04_ACESA|nr:hypothetical protein LWI29_017789 [Acer saccharum]